MNKDTLIHKDVANKTIYARIVQSYAGSPDYGKTWNQDIEELALTVVWADSVVAITKKDGFFPLVLPADLPVGVYDIVFYEDTGTPVIGDTIAGEIDQYRVIAAQGGHGF